MSYGLVISHVGKGLLAARPTVLNLPDGTVGFYYATDNNTSYVYSSDNGWQDLSTYSSVDPAITAGTTQTLAGATVIAGAFANIAVCANSGDGVALPTAVAARVGKKIWVTNNGAAPAKVWPQAADKIDGGTTAAGVTLTNAKSALFVCIAVNNWLSIGFSGKSA